MAAPSQPVTVSVISSPRNRGSVPESPFPPPTVREEDYSHTAKDRSPVNPMGTAVVQQPPRPGSSHNTHSSKRFSSRFSQLAKRAMGKPGFNDPERRAEEGLSSASARAPSPPATSSAGSSSDVYEGTTAVGHDDFHFAQTIGSPVYIEPKPTNDYAKMDSPRASIASFNSYLNRVKQFLHELNELPWVAERVTIDYVPGVSKDRRRARVNRLQRPLSWYGNTSHSRRPSLFSDSTESPGAQLPQVQLLSQDQFPTLQSLNRSHSAQKEPPRTPTPRQDVFWEITDTSYPSNVPYATVVPPNWTIHQAVPPEPLQPIIATEQPQLEPHPPPKPQLAVNLSSTTAHPQASTRLYPGIPTDSLERFVPVGETFPGGYVPYKNVASIEAAYRGGRFHPQSQDPVLQQSGSVPAATSAEQAGQDGFEAGAPQTARGLDTFVTPLGQAGGATPYNPSTQPPVVAPTPRVASGSVAPGGGLANAGGSPRARAVSPASSGRPSRASSTSQRGHRPTPVRKVQNEDCSLSATPSRASRASSTAHAISQTPNRHLSAASSHAN